jgi:hypothetical protein
MDDFIRRLRFFLSLEFICTMVLTLGLSSIATKLGLVPLHRYSYNVIFVPAIQRYVDLNNFYVAIITLISMIIVYGIGEFIRRKFKLKSLLFKNKK